jgi:hypothetical protein
MIVNSKIRVHIGKIAESCETCQFYKARRKKYKCKTKRIPAPLEVGEFLPVEVLGRTKNLKI